jgi:N-methylhydantoinase B
MRISDILIGAFAKALPRKMPASSSAQTCAVCIGGVNPDTGIYGVFVEVLGGGMGARPIKDGIDAVDVHVANCTNVPIEAAELEYPILFKKYELITDSGGAGIFRGGLGFRRDYCITAPNMRLTIRSDAEKTNPSGLEGGKSGLPGSKYINPGTPNERRLYSKTTDYSVKEGDVISIRTPGSGGYGDPKLRPMTKVLEDCLNRKISQDSAREDYGIEVDLKNKRIISVNRT